MENTIDFDAILDALDVAAKSYPIKALAPEIGAGESTLRNELNPNLQDQYKMGLLRAILIMKKTGDLKALDMTERVFNRVAFFIPEPEPERIVPLIEMLATITKEFGETMEAIAKAIEDNRITKKEARKVLRELGELVEVCMYLKAYLEQFLT